MADMVKTPLDVSFQNPYRGFSLIQIGKTLLNRIMCSSADSESVGIGVCRGFCDGLQRIIVQRLHGTIFHRGDAQRPHLSILFRNVDASERRRLVATPFKLVNCVQFCLRCQPKFMVNTWSLFALITCYTLHSHCFGIERVCQQPLQGFYLV